jgi:hypothetical protein
MAVDLDTDTDLETIGIRSCKLNSLTTLYCLVCWLRGPHNLSDTRVMLKDNTNFDSAIRDREFLRTWFVQLAAVGNAANYKTETILGTRISKTYISSSNSPLASVYSKLLPTVSSPRRLSSQISPTHSHTHQIPAT